MYKVLLVDDEENNLMLMASMISWEQLGFQVTGQIQDPTLVMDYLRDNPVDVIFLDIKMPKMDGLELLREIRSQYSAVTIVYLTAYPKFEYAQYGIRYHVFGYLVKPITRSDLRDCLREICSKLDQTRARKDSNQTLRSARVYLEKYVKSAFNSAVWPVVRHPAVSGAVFCCRADSARLSTALQKLEIPAVAADVQNECWVLLSDRPDPRILEAAVDCCASAFPLEIPGREPGDILQEIVSRSNQAFYGSLDRTSPVPMFCQAQLPAKALDLIRSAAAGLQAQALQEELSRLIRTMQAKNTNHILAKTLCTEYITVFYNALRSSGFHIAQPLSANLNACASSNALEQTVSELICRQITGLKDQLATDPRELFSQRITNYMEQNYNSREASVSSAAASMGISVAHFNRMYKDLSGNSFWSDFMSLRLEKGRQLLISTDKKMSEIAQNVGFENEFYFSQCFKKKYGSSPRTYRQENRP